MGEAGERKQSMQNQTQTDKHHRCARKPEPSNRNGVRTGISKALQGTMFPLACCLMQTLWSKLGQEQDGKDSSFIQSSLELQNQVVFGPSAPPPSCLLGLKL